MFTCVISSHTHLFIYNCRSPWSRSLLSCSLVLDYVNDNDDDDTYALHVMISMMLEITSITNYNDNAGPGPGRRQRGGAGGGSVPVRDPFLGRREQGPRNGPALPAAQPGHGGAAPSSRAVCARAGARYRFSYIQSAAVQGEDLKSQNRGLSRPQIALQSSKPRVWGYFSRSLSLSLSLSLFVFIFVRLSVSLRAHCVR